MDHLGRFEKWINENPADMEAIYKLATMHPYNMSIGEVKGKLLELKRWLARMQIGSKSDQKKANKKNWKRFIINNLSRGSYSGNRYNNRPSESHRVTGQYKLS